MDVFTVLSCTYISDSLLDSTVDIILINITSLDNKSRNDIVYVNKKVPKNKNRIYYEIIVIEKITKIII